MPIARQCLECHALLPDEVPDGACPVCALQGALAQDGDQVFSPSHSFSKVRYFGDYEMLGEIAHGGMGVVFKARQMSLNRLVALKMILSGQFAGEVEVKRFRNEAEAAANLDHPNIVPIYEVGEYDGRHFFSMRLVEGGNLAGHMAGFKGDLKSAAKLMTIVARAIHYAHQRGILHRDLKPSNILIDAAGQPHVTDFGLAKLIKHDSELTYSGSLLGTPNYMSPEQALGKAKQFTTASDIFSLGAIFYQMLTGCLAFQADTSLETIKKVAEVNPKRPSVINREVDRDLETICLKCLEKEPQRRYGSADSLSEDLQNWLDGKMIQARPAHIGERFWKWARRHPVMAVLNATVVLLIMVIAIGSTLALLRITKERQRTETALERVSLEMSEVRFAANDSEGALAVLAHILRQNPSNYAAANRLFFALDQLPFEIPCVPFLAHEKLLNFASFDVGGTRIATAANDYTARIWDANTGKPLTPPLADSGAMLYAAFSPDDKLLATASLSGTVQIYTIDGKHFRGPFRLHSEPTPITAETNGAPIIRLEFSQDGGKLMVVFSESGVCIWDVQTGKLLVGPFKSDGDILDARFSNSGEHIITGSSDGIGQIWNTATGQADGPPLKNDGALFSAQFSPDDGEVLTAGMDNTVKIWNTQSGTPVGQPFRLPKFSLPLGSGTNRLWLMTASSWPANWIYDFSLCRLISNPLQQGGLIYHAEFSPDGQRILTASFDGTVRVWDVPTCTQLFDAIRHGEKVREARFSPDGQRLITASFDGTARVWDALTGQPLTGPLMQGAWVFDARFSPDGQRIVTAGGDGTARIWDAQSGKSLPILLRHQDSLSVAGFSPDGKSVLTASFDGTARVWDAETGLPKTQPLETGSPIHAAVFSPDGKYVATGSRNGRVAVWNLATGKMRFPPIETDKLYDLAFDKSGRHLITAGVGAARIWDASTGLSFDEPLWQTKGFGVRCIAFDNTGKKFLTGSWDHTVCIWDAVTGKQLGRTDGNIHSDKITSASFSPDGKKFVTASADNSARVWYAADCRQATPPLWHNDMVCDAVFSPDGRRIATASMDGTAKIWDAETGAMIGEPMKHNGWVWSVEFSPDGRHLASASYDGTVMIWDAFTGKALAGPFRQNGPVNSVHFSPDGKRLVTASLDGAARIFELPEPSLPVPSWFLDLAEGIAGKRLDDAGHFESISATNLFNLKSMVQQTNANDFYTHWAKWFFSDKSTRPISFLSKITVPDYVNQRIADDNLASLREAIQMSPTNALAHVRLALCFLKGSKSQDPSGWKTADFLSRRALKLDPNNPEAKNIHNEIVNWMQSLTNGPAAVRQGLLE